MLNLSKPADIGITLGGDAVSLGPMTAAEANRLGAAFSVIEPWSRYPLPSGALVRHLDAAEPGAPRYLIHAGHAPAGTLTVRINWLGGPYLQFLAILPEFQSRGIGSLVLNWLETAARSEKARNIWVAASDFNEGAIRLYERHGFVRLAVIDSLLVDGRDEVLMRKKL